MKLIALQTVIDRISTVQTEQTAEVFRNETANPGQRKIFVRSGYFV